MKFAEIQSLPFVFENFSFENPVLYNTPDVVVDNKGKWNFSFFKNLNPIILELACGGGEYSISLAQNYKDSNYIGIDIKGARIWKGAKYVLEKGLTNIGFIRSRIELIEHFFAEKELSEIWITFPDPFLKESKSNKRLTSPYFLDKYAQLIKPSGILHLKTDDDTLMDFSIESIGEHPAFEIVETYFDLYNDSEAVKNTNLVNIQTKYEKMHLSNNKTIKYIKARRI
ncbi:MAG: tRNA (guanosine(46)-N7)-methyltransferase TrmB [Saprospiraceae bacterium]|nr:tRNA (guanosine(46)-N7)-methyltransferase TrmB [Saprospiraceae bacterium]